VSVLFHSLASVGDTLLEVLLVVGDFLAAFGKYLALSDDRTTFERPLPLVWVLIIHNVTRQTFCNVGKTNSAIAGRSCTASHNSPSRFHCWVR